MIEHIWSVLCSKSVIDSESNNLSLIEVIEEIKAEGPTSPAESTIVLPIKMELVSLWTRSLINMPATSQGKMTFYSPKDIAVHANEFSIDLSTHLRTRTRLLINGLPVKNEAGQYYFIIQLKQEDGSWKTVSRVPLQITLVIKT